MRLKKRTMDRLAYVIASEEKKFFLGYYMQRIGRTYWDRDIDESSSARQMARNILILLGIVINSEPLFEDGHLVGVKVMFDENSTVTNTVYESVYYYSDAERERWDLDNIRFK